MCVKTLPGVRLKLSDDAELGRGNWNGYAYAEPIVRRLRQSQSVRLAAGQRCGFANLLYTTDAQRPQQFSLAAIGGGQNGAGGLRPNQTTGRGRPWFTATAGPCWPVWATPTGRGRSCPA